MPTSRKRQSRRSRSAQWRGFIPDNLDQPAIDLRVVAIDTAGAEGVREPILHATNGGPIAVAQDDLGRMAPLQALYRVVLAPQESEIELAMTLRGVAVIDARRESLVARLWEQVAGILIREVSQ